MLALCVVRRRGSSHFYSGSQCGSKETGPGSKQGLGDVLTRTLTTLESPTRAFPFVPTSARAQGWTQWHLQALQDGHV